MRKIAFFIVLSLTSLSCLAQLPKDPILYHQCKVKKIKKIENAYIIYLKVPEIFSRGTIAVISPFCSDREGIRIRKLKKYDLLLASCFEQYIVWMHNSFYDITIDNINIRLREDGSIHGMLFHSPNICGIYYKPPD